MQGQKMYGVTHRWTLSISYQTKHNVLIGYWAYTVVFCAACF